MSVALISFIASVSYGLPSACLYVITFFVIIKNRKTFDSSFFEIYLYDGAMNLLTYFTGFFTMRLNKITCEECLMALLYKNLDGLLLQLIGTMGVHMAYVQYSMSTLVSLNRLSVLLNFNFFEPIWKKCIWIVVILIYFIPFLNTNVVFNNQMKITHSEEDDSYSITSPELPITKIYGILIPFMFITTIVCVFCNTISIIFISKMSIHRKTAEFNVLIMMSITCSVQIVGTVITIALQYFSTSPLVFSILGMMLPYSSDGLSLVQPWLLVCFSHSMREEMKSMFGLTTQRPDRQLFHTRSFTN
ncbi:hypothetical protein CRE_12149 [Caenorhabditis remanei]|uniref:Serpentine receptor class gamma n=1 Tax=Caenorhabditis remanei TaxID=31234 RepID=E3N059_CAERE|nr:hypothetical protein CRE_12149 [Caenorhabditis remanei]